jgi:mono/diheme cytochrome c family protein
MRIIKSVLAAVVMSLMMISVSAVNAADVFDGKEVYMRHCMGCHGSSGVGNMPGLPNFTRGDQMFKSNSELYDAIRDGSGIMPGFNGLLTDDEIENVIAYIRTFL